MESGNLKNAFREILRKEDSIEKAYTTYAELIDEKVNQQNLDNATHVIIWTNKHGLRGGLDRFTRSVITLFSRTRSSRTKPFNFKTYHSLDEVEFEALQAGLFRGSGVENLSSFLAGIFVWLFTLSIPVIPLVGATFLSLTCISFFVFLGSVYSLSSARYRYLPSEFRNIAADHWAVQTVTGIQQHSD